MDRSKSKDTTSMRNSKYNIKYIIASILMIPLVAWGSTNVFDLLKANRLDVDNVRVDGNTISTTNTNGDLTLDMNGTGSVILTDLSATTVPYLDASKKIKSSAVTPTELGYVSGVTSALQTQLNLKAPLASPTFSGTITTPLTASRALVTGASSELAAATTTATEIGYVNGVTSAIQTQMNLKAPLASPTFTGTFTGPWTTAGPLITSAGGVVTSESTLAVARGGTNLGSGTSGGVLAYTASGTLASSAALAANQIVLGGGAGAVPATLASLGTTTTLLHGNAAGAPTFGAVALATDVSGTLAVGNGGTGQTSYTDGQLLIGNSSGNTLTKATLSAGTNITITNGGGSISIAASSSASPAWTYTSQTTTYSAVVNDWILASGSSFTITLPTAVGQSGKSIVIQHNGTALTQVYTLNTTSAQTIGGIASGAYKLTTTGEVLIVLSDGTNWQILGHQTESGPTAFTPTFSAGWGTVTSKNFYWSRHGRLMKIFGYATCGTVANSLGSVSIPASAVIDTTVHGSNTTAAAGSRVGYMNNGQTASFCPMVTAGGTSTTLIYLGGLVSANIPLIPTATTANNMGSNSTIFALDAELAIVDWQP